MSNKRMKPPMEGTMNLGEYLGEHGYQRIRIKRSAAGHFQFEGTLNGKPITVLVDTGAGGTVIALDLARKLRLEMEQTGNTGGGAGGVSLPVYQVSGARLNVAGVEPTVSSIVAMDFSHINEGLVCKGCDPIEAILGANVFDAHSAVIDYGSSSLYLKMSDGG